MNKNNLITFEELPEDIIESHKSEQNKILFIIKRDYNKIYVYFKETIVDWTSCQGRWNYDVRYKS